MSKPAKTTDKAHGAGPIAIGSPDPNAVPRDDIYNLESAAKRCRVSTKQILDWIDQGLRAFPIGESIKYRARDYVILEEWLLDFFRSRGGILRKAEAAEKAADTTKKGARANSRNRDQPLGPCPV